MPEGQVKNRLNARQIWAVVILDLLLLGEITFAVYVAQQDVATMTLRFLSLFIPMVLGTYVLARVLLRVLRTPEAPAEQGGEAVPASF